MSLFLTDPDNQSDNIAIVEKPKAKRRGQFFRFQDAVQQVLQNSGIPFRCAEVAVIDLRGTVVQAFHGKCTPTQTAELLVPRMKELYQENGKWHYQT